MGAAELKTRLIFGPLMLGIIAAVFWVDSTTVTAGRLTCGLLGLLAVAGVWEFQVMMRGAGHALSAGWLLIVSAALAGSAFLFAGWQQLDRELYPLVIGTMALLFPVALRTLAEQRMRQGLAEQGAVLLAFVWIAWPMYMAQGMAIRHLPAVLFVVLVCKGGDIGAYFAGVAFGRHKLIPHVSKGKTVEGSIGSVVASCAVAVALRDIMLPAPLPPLGLTAVLFIGIILNLGAQIGDLLESLLKRNCGVKDSSKLLPAHGGVLDLIDSLLFAFPAYFLVLVWLTDPQG